MHPHCTTKAASQPSTNYTNWKKNRSELVDTGQRRQARLIEHEWNGKFLHAFVVLPLLTETRFLSAHPTLLVYLGDLLGKTRKNPLNLLRIVFCRVLSFIYILFCSCTCAVESVFRSIMLLAICFRAILF